MNKLAFIILVLAVFVFANCPTQSHSEWCAIYKAVPNTIYADGYTSYGGPQQELRRLFKDPCAGKDITYIGRMENKDGGVKSYTIGCNMKYNDSWIIVIDEHSYRRVDFPGVVYGDKADRAFKLMRSSTKWIEKKVLRSISSWNP